MFIEDERVLGLWCLQVWTIWPFWPFRIVERGMAIESVSETGAHIRWILLPWVIWRLWEHCSAQGFHSLVWFQLGQRYAGIL